MIEQQLGEEREWRLLIARNRGSALQRYHRDLVSSFESFVPLIARGERPGFASKPPWAIVLALAIALILAYFPASPVDRVARVALRMADGETGARLEEKDLALALLEAHELGEAFNAMAEQIQTAQEKESELRRQAEAAAIAKSDFLANMSH